jgi:hypothetical protein
VEPKSAVAFPAAEPTLKELRDQVQMASTIAILGAALGVIGIVVGFLAMRTKRS